VNEAGEDKDKGGKCSVSPFCIFVPGSSQKMMELKTHRLCKKNIENTLI
jgi:hypothetical protein